MAKAFASSTGAEFISPYNDADVIAGAATIALEVFEDAPGTDTLVVPIGGGGLISGVAAAAKSIAPACEIVGVEVAASCAFQTSVRAGRLVEIVPGATLADGLGGNPDPETITFGFIQRFVDEIVTLPDPEIFDAMIWVMERCKVMPEAAAAASVGALLRGLVKLPKGSRVVCVLSGGNLNLDQIRGLKWN